MQNESRKGRSDDPIAGILDLTNPKTIPAAAYWCAIVQTVNPLCVAVGELLYNEDEIRLCRQLTNRIEQVEPLSWQTENETCTVSHRHAIEGIKEMQIFSPLKAGDVLLCFPSADQQTLIAVDILKK